MPHGVTLMMLLVVVGLSLMASVIFLWLQRQITEGIATSGIK